MAERLLVVEDEAHLAEVIADNLELEGFDVEVVGDGAEALERIRAGAPDLVLLDVMLPGMDGFSFIDRLRAEPGCGSVPVIALTADAMPDQVSRGKEAGLSDYLTKPIDLEELRATVYRTLLAA